MNPDVLLKQMRKSREQVEEVGDHKFTIRRPTKYGMAIFNDDGSDMFEVVASCVVDWQGFTEADLVPSGGSDVVPFDDALWREWLAEHNEVWSPLRDAIMKAFVDHAKATEQTEKNS